MTTPPVTLMEVAVEGGARFTAGVPRLLLKGPNGYVAPQYGRPYDITSDGKRFLMMETAETGWVARATVHHPLIVIQNWFEELKRLAPTN